MGKISLLLVWIVACMTAEVTVASDPVRIGVTIALSSEYAPMAQMYADGLRLWVKQQNAKGGLLGRPVHLIIHDDHGNPETAAKLYREMISNGEVDLVFGPFSSYVSKAVVPILEQYRYPTLMPMTTAESIWEASPRYVFGVAIPEQQWTRAIFTLLAIHNVTHIYLLVDHSLMKLGTPRGAQKWARRFGLNILAREPVDERDLDRQLQRARDSGAEAVLLWAYLDGALAVRKALAHIDWTPRIFFSQAGPSLDEYGKVLGDLANYSLACSVWEADIGSRFPGAGDFLELFRKEYKINPTYHAANGFAAGIILSEAVSRAGEMNRQKIRKELSALDTITLVGRYSVDERGLQIRRHPVIVQWQDGRKRVIWPESIRTAPLRFPPKAKP